VSLGAVWYFICANDWEDVQGVAARCVVISYKLITQMSTRLLATMTLRGIKQTFHIEKTERKLILPFLASHTAIKRFLLLECINVLIYLRGVNFSLPMVKLNHLT
jgi:hypothetical protein